MRRASCADLAELWSAFVDEALTNTDRDRLLAHLAGCPSCRQEVADLRAVRDIVGRARGPLGPAPTDLSARLVSIGGPDPTAPMWSRPFRRSPPGLLPSPRRTVRVRATVAGVAVGAAVAVVGVAGYAAAPAELAAVADPSGEAGVEFRAALGRLPLGSDALSAAMLAEPAGLVQTATNAAPDGPPAPTGDTMTALDASDALLRAARAAGSLSFTGQQRLVAYGSARVFTAQARVVNRPGQGRQVDLVSRTGSPMADFSSASTSPVVDGELLALLQRTYRLSGQHGAVVAGRPASLVEASRDARVVGRWWVDDATGVVLWQQSFDDAGALQLSAGFTWIMMNDRSGLIAHFPPRLILSITTVPLALTDAESLRAAGWSCPSELTGLSLVRLRVDQAAAPGAVHLTYSDGLHTISVVEQRGRLGQVPAGSQWNTAVAAHVQQGPSGLATWQSGSTVFTVMTDGSAARLARAVTALPHDPPRQRTTMERIQAGWGEILADMRG